MLLKQTCSDTRTRWDEVFLLCVLGGKIPEADGTVILSEGKASIADVTLKTYFQVQILKA